jgi:predicted transcriptional regulator
VLLRTKDTLHRIQLCSMPAAMQHQGSITVTNETTETNAALITMVSDVVSAYVSNNHVASADLPALIATVHAAISGLAGSAVAEAPAAATEKPTPAQIRKSVTREALISFIDGKPYKTLKRHLTKHGLDPVGYRQRFGLPADYPMVCPAYSETRSNLAKALGLGRLGNQVEETTPTPKGRKKAA